MTIGRLSHVLLRVENLQRAVGAYRDAGFTCEYGSRESKAHNAFIRFADGPFLELFKRPRLSRLALGIAHVLLGPQSAARFKRWGELGEGPCDYAIEIDDFDLGNAVTRIRKQGLGISNPHTFRRRRNDGIRLKWQLAFPDDLDLPFLMGRYEPENVVASGGTVHTSGAHMLSQLTIQHPHAEGYRRRLAVLVGGDEALHNIRVEDGPDFALDKLEMRGANMPSESLRHAAIIASGRATADPK